MRKTQFGLFALFVVLGNQFGSMFGIAIAISVFMIVDGIIEIISSKKFKEKFSTKEDK